MELAIISTFIFGLSCILISIRYDVLSKRYAKEKKTDENKINRLSLIKDAQKKIIYTSNPETVVDTIAACLPRLFDCAVVSSMMVKDNKVLFKSYVKENVGADHMEKVEESILSSFEKLVGKLPTEIDRKVFGSPIHESIKSIYASSFHTPLVANNKVLALFFLSSMNAKAFENTQDVHELIDVASSVITHFSQTIEDETERYSALIESVDNGVVLVDENNNILTFNPYLKNLLETQVVDFASLIKAFGEGFDLAKKINKVIVTKIPHFEKEIQVNGKTFNMSINPAGDDKASIVLTEMTEYKKKEVMKEDLINIMVHELRSPVTTIKDSAELISTSTGPGSLSEEKKAKFMEIIHNQSKKVLDQIGIILDTAKLDAGKLVLQKKQSDIENLIKNEVQSFMPQAQKKNVALTFENLASYIPEISFDETRICQVIDNFLSNSFKFTPENGKVTVRIDYKTIPPVLDGISPMKDFLSLDKFVVISVTDTGAGIPLEQQKRLFSKYTQAENTGKVATKGTGLGLYLVKGIIEAHNGKVWVKSNPGEGSTFFFALPSTNSGKTTYEAPKATTAPISQISQTMN
jgi:two-component system, OmpR family, phosphate regulon sensor histidine kinase PhoR